MSNNVISLSDHLFADCINLYSFEGGEKVENIYKGTFQNTHLESITFNNLKLVSVDSFFNNKYLKDVTLLGEYTSLSGSSFERCPALENVNLSSSVTKIDNYAFKDCSLLTNFDFTNITSIGKYAFENCNIAEVKTSSLSLLEGSFASCKNLKTIDQYFDMVNLLEEDRDRLLKDFLHGMKNKMQMACFLIARPPIILLDEPLTSFDVVVALEIKNLLKQIKHDHIIIFSTHILQLATDLCDEIVVLNNGILEEVESDILKSPEFEKKVIEILKDDSHV